MQSHVQTRLNYHLCAPLQPLPTTEHLYQHLKVKYSKPNSSGHLLIKEFCLWGHYCLSIQTERPKSQLGLLFFLLPIFNGSTSYVNSTIYIFLIYFISLHFQCHYSVGSKNISKLSQPPHDWSLLSHSILIHQPHDHQTVSGSPDPIRLLIPMFKILQWHATAYRMKSQIFSMPLKAFCDVASANLRSFAHALSSQSPMHQLCFLPCLSHT